MASLVCWSCGESLDDLPRPITRHINCPACFEDLHCCRMCRNYLANATISCAEERADPPANKENANFCDYFRPINAYRSGSKERQTSAKARLDSIFDSEANDGEETERDDTPLEADDKEAEARRRLQDLFGP